MLYFYRLSIRTQENITKWDIFYSKPFYNKVLTEDFVFNVININLNDKAELDKLLRVDINLF